MILNFTSLILIFTSIHLSYATALPNTLSDLAKKSPSGSAGLRWGPYEVGPLKLYITNPHTGYAGPKFNNAPHINVHVDRKAERNQYKEVVNLHVVKYTRAGKHCLYMWDSKSGKTIFDKCFDNFEDAAKEGVETAKEVVDAVMEGVGFLAKIAATVALGIALIAAILLSGLTGVAA
ncbi:hypothetical protein H2198_004254 [Neophaeococcomyces mojaviensis]|uniref:Uncharacterized protein n=1 Tax=Neophaeococcomyces mojaviensis TaxID=3383035 RepID=A0ACC3A8Z8_9EURO|nr:hypothetical protein H2198_004254 [Knufia sp. JES_112]